MLMSWCRSAPSGRLAGNLGLAAFLQTIALLEQPTEGSGSGRSCLAAAPFEALNESASSSRATAKLPSAHCTDSKRYGYVATDTFQDLTERP